MLMSQLISHLQQAGASVFIPDETDEGAAFGRITHLGIGAHPDDLEFMAWHPIIRCASTAEQWFAAVTCTNGQGSPRQGRFAGLDDREMVELRRQEQRAAARLGNYAAHVSLDHASHAIRTPPCTALRADLLAVMARCRPQCVYTHNPLDRHDTHVAVCAAVVDAIRCLPREQRPERLYGCEVWRSLDWHPDPSTFDVSDGQTLMARLMRQFTSQIEGGKRYDVATLGRKRANATWQTAHETDQATAIEYALDMTTLIENPGPSLR